MKKLFIFYALVVLLLGTNTVKADVLNSTTSSSIKLQQSPTILVGKCKAFKGETIGIPVLFDNSNDSVCYNFKLTYNPKYLQFKDTVTLLDKAIIDTSNAHKGEIIISSRWEQGEPVDSGLISILNFKVLQVNPYIRVTVVDTSVTNSEYNDSTVTIVNGNVDSREYGDILNSGKVDMSDVLECVRVVMGSIELKGDNLKASDVNGDGKISNIDVMLILKRASGYNLVFPTES